ncbi:DNA polymerase IV [Candidatus Bipolaricaulota bacterium]
MHLDMDSYFASVEQQANPTLRGKPIGVTGRPTEKSIIVAGSREAKQFGVKSGMAAWKAKQLCPHLLLVSGHGIRYREITKQFLRILDMFSPVVEVFSVDEVFMNVTQEVERYGGSIHMARAIKHAFRDSLGEYITATVGIASSKTFAKLIGARHKPDGIGWLDEEEVPELLESTSVGEICGIGPRIEARLRRLGIRTLAELGDTPDPLLRREFGVYGHFLKAVGSGYDPNPVSPYSELSLVKSIGHSRSLRPDLRDMESALLVLRGLCDRVAWRMRRSGYVGRTVHCGYRSISLTESRGKQTTLPIPTDDGHDIYLACLKILDEMNALPDAVSKIGLSVSNLQEKMRTAIPLFAMDRRRDRLNCAIDGIRERFGEKAIRTADTLLFKPIPDHVSGFTMTQEEWED